jgi:RimJ/RimL family protein N-acetyltransferase
MSYAIWQDSHDIIADWVCRGLGLINVWKGQNVTYGFSYASKMVGGLIFHELQPHRDVWWTVWSNDKHWCNRTMLRQMFHKAFVEMDCKRINILVNVNNQRSLNFVERLGFVREGRLRQYDDNGEDCYFLGMLREECKWLNKKQENKNE